DTFQVREQDAFSFHLRSFFLKCVEVFVIGIAVFAVGRMFGGTGGRPETFAVVAWHTLVTSFLSPLFLMGQDAITMPAEGADPSQVPQADGVKLLLVLLFVGLWLWLMAKYVAELHGFKSIWMVVVGVVVTQFCFGLLAVILLPGLT
ncbi:MAG: YIP1 family protein, partial [Pseudomonadota bacterium]